MEPINVVYDICREYMKDLTDVNPALRAKIGGYLRSRNLAGLASCTNHLDLAFHSVEDWRALKQVEAFFKKNSLFSEKEKCSQAAKQSFMKAEQACKQTNLRLDFFYAQRGLLDPDLDSKLSRMERYISNVLGDYRSFLNELPRLVRVTSGATSTAARRESIPQMKMRMSLFCTTGARPYLSALYRYYGFNAPRLKDATTNRVELVPKNWKTDRTIACEPEGNLPLQLAFDTYAKRRLRRVGIDLSTQLRNQRKAHEGSVQDRLATVDFSAASDTISFNTVAWLFPYDWFSFLCHVRSPNYRGVFGEGQYHKFSSMGNGTTFTIETLVFAAACYAVGSKDFLVYGDDVIIESELFDDYHKLTRFLGFTINTEKTFVHGPFRESCGLDVYDGCDITPVYISGLDKRKASQCHLVNSLAKIAYPGGHLARLLASLVRAWQLPFVPYNLSTISGVWLHPADCHDRGLFRHGRKAKPYIREVRCYVPMNERKRFVDARGYYLWFMNKLSPVLYHGPWHLKREKVSNDETSWAPIFLHKYVRKWVVWQPPHDGIPDHLYWWSEQVLLPLSG